MKEHADLLSSVRDDISEYKVRPSDFEVINNLLLPLWTKIEFMQASGNVSPRMQLLRERAAIHGSISHVRLKLLILSWYIFQINVSLWYSKLVIIGLGWNHFRVNINFPYGNYYMSIKCSCKPVMFAQAPAIGILAVVIMTSPIFKCLKYDTPSVS